LGTWKTKVDVYIALTEFARQKFILGGLPGERILVKPNFPAGEFVPKTQPGEHALFVGRLSVEKGVHDLPLAWSMLTQPVPLKIVGDGPQMDALSRAAREGTSKQLELKGRLGTEQIRLLMSKARFLVFPSVWYEGFPMVIGEALAAGLPVIASKIGSLMEVVRDGVTGLHFEPGNAADLAAKVEWAWTHPEEMARMGRAARTEYEARYTPAINYKLLIEIYQRAVDLRAQRGSGAKLDVELSGVVS